MNNDGERNSSATLDQASLDVPLAVLSTIAPLENPEWARLLEEIGFVPGEEVRLMARAMPGGDPLVVRVGQSTFALRCAEAACVEVTPIECRVAVTFGNSLMKGVQA